MYLSGDLVALAASVMSLTLVAWPARTAPAPGLHGESDKFRREPKIVGGYAVRMLIYPSPLYPRRRGLIAQNPPLTCLAWEYPHRARLAGAGDV